MQITVLPIFVTCDAPGLLPLKSVKLLMLKDFECTIYFECECATVDQIIYEYAKLLCISC